MFVAPAVSSAFPLPGPSGGVLSRCRPGAIRPGSGCACGLLFGAVWSLVGSRHPVPPPPLCPARPGVWGGVRFVGLHVALKQQTGQAESCLKATKKAKKPLPLPRG